MTKHYLNLPGDCYVNQIDNISNGIALNAEFLCDYGFNPQHKPTLLISKEYVVITSNPDLCNILNGILELQLWQDEIKQDFEPAIYRLKEMFVPLLKESH